MDDPVFDKIVGFMVAVLAAAAAALMLGLILHFDYGLSRLDIRMLALTGAAIIAVLLATEYFGMMLRKSK
jgi:hypothetical protein